MDDQVQWRPVPGFAAYEVSNFGSVRRAVPCGRLPAGPVLKHRLGTHGYPQVCLSREGKYTHFSAHRLVALAFLGPPPTKRHQVAHNDGSRTNNHVSNLRWATPSENNLDRSLHGTVPDRKGERHPLAKLTDELVLELRDQRLRGRTYTELAQSYRIPKLTLYDAVVGTTWRHLPGAVGACRHRHKSLDPCR
jgi:hypothetical protein